MSESNGWRRRFVTYVEAKSTTDTFVYLSVKVPRAMADAVSRECAAKGQHAMVYYCDAFAGGLSDALTATDR